MILYNPKRLKLIRCYRGYTFLQLAKKAGGHKKGFTQELVQRMETEESVFDKERILLLSNALKFPIEFFQDERDPIDFKGFYIDGEYHMIAQNKEPQNDR